MRHRWWRTGSLLASGVVVLGLVAPGTPAQADNARHWRLGPPGVRATGTGPAPAADLSLSRAGALSLTVHHHQTTA